MDHPGVKTRRLLHLNLNVLRKKKREKKTKKNRSRVKTAQSTSSSRIHEQINARGPNGHQMELIY